MTNQEAKALRPGEIVEAREHSAHRWFLARVKAIVPDYVPWAGAQSRGLTVAVVRLGKMARGGRPFPVSYRDPDWLRHLPSPPPFDPLPANVYADWLEEHGQQQAADMLRLAFPLGDSPPPPPSA